MIFLTAGALTVRYSKSQDRLSHTIGLEVGASYFPMLESIEGTANEAWPASPPMQQMVEESFANNAAPVLLGVGQSGNGHWSTAIESQHSCLLKFDIACKNSKCSTWFGSQYRVLGNVRRTILQNRLEIPCDSATQDPRLHMAHIDFTVAMGRLEFSESERCIFVSPLSEPKAILTHRWCYEVSIVGRPADSLVPVA